MKFPIVNVTAEKGDLEDYGEYVRHYEFFYSNSERSFQKYLKDQTFCDSNGQLFKATSRVKDVALWRRILWFVPNVYK